MKECKHCHKNLPVTEFYKYKNKIHSYCNNCESIRRKTKCREYKIKCLQYKNTYSCEICGYNKSINALDFHHKDKKIKDFTISSSRYRILNNKVKHELDKCMVVCANCHREIHEDTSIINFKTHINDKIRKIIYCVDCKKQISYQATRCLDCNSKYKSKNQPTKEELQIDIDTIKYFTKIGKKYGVSDNAVRKWCKKYNI